MDPYPASWDTTYCHMYALFTEERNESINLVCLLIVLIQVFTIRVFTYVNQFA